MRLSAIRCSRKRRIHLRDVPDRVTVTRKRHAFERRTLSAISSIKRRGALLVLVILPNGSRSLIPAAWTDWRGGNALPSDGDIDHRSSLGKLGDLLQLGTVIDAVLSRAPESAPPVESSHAAEPGVSDLSQPPSRRPPTSPPPAAWEQLDEAARLAALAVLARLIARMPAEASAKENGHE